MINEQLTKVESSNIDSIGYDSSSRELCIVFLSNLDKMYVYSNVPKEVYDEMLKAPSLGSFFHKKIKDIYTFKTEEI